MGHEAMSDDPKDLHFIAVALKKRIADAKARAAALENELRLVNEKLVRVGGVPVEP